MSTERDCRPMRMRACLAPLLAGLLALPLGAPAAYAAVVAPAHDHAGHDHGSHRHGSDGQDGHVGHDHTGLGPHDHAQSEEAGATTLMASDGRPPHRPARGPKTLRGTYQRLATDVADRKGGPTHDVYQDLLVIGNRSVRLNLPAHLRPKYGSQVELSGMGDDTTLDVASARQVATAEEEGPVHAPSVATTGTTSVLVILVKWDGNPQDDVTPAKATDVVFTQGNAYFKEASYNQLSLTGRVTPWVHVATPSRGCYGDHITLMTRAKAAAKALGPTYDPANYNRTMLYFSACADGGFAAGWAYIGVNQVWINGYMDKRVTVHEEGHNYGLGHAHSLNCSAGARHTTINPMPNPLAGCTSVDYGDPFDAMGSSSYSGHFNAPHKTKLGWMTDRISESHGDGSLKTLLPFETSTAGLKATYFDVSLSRRYWVEFRTPTGQDKSFPAGGLGIQVHMVQSSYEDGGPNLLDMLPNDDPYDDLKSVRLPAGSSWISPEGWKIRVGTVSGTAAQVYIGSGAGVATKPNVVTDVSATAGDTRAGVTWAKPGDNGSTITAYIVTTYSDSAGAAVPGPVTIPSIGGTATAASIPALTNGKLYRFTVKARNAVGDSNLSAASNSVTPVEPVPSVTVTAPAQGSVQTGIVTLTASAAPSPISRSAIESVDFYVDGEWAGTDTTAPYTQTWDPGIAVDGSHTVYADARDVGGHDTRSGTRTFTLNVPLPTVTILEPVAGADLTAESVPMRVLATAGSPSRPVSYVEVTLAEGGNAGYLGPDATIPDLWVGDWYIRGLEAGPHTLTATAYDDYDRKVQSIPVTVDIVHPSPRITITSPAQSVTITDTIDLTVLAQPHASGYGGVVNYVEYVLDGTTPVGWATETPFTFVGFDPRTFTNGPHQFTARAYNTEGFSATSAPLFVTIKNPKPNVVIGAPTSGATLTGDSVGLTATPTPDPVTAHAITRLYFLLDGQYVAEAYDVDLDGNSDGVWTTVWDSRFADIGSRVLTAQVEDAGGYSATSAGVPVTVQNPGPSITLDTPASGRRITGPAPVTVSFTAQPDATLPDDVVTQVALLLDGYDIGYDEDGVAPWTVPLDPAYLTPGTHTLRGRVYNSVYVGRYSNTVTVHYITVPYAPSSVTATPSDTVAGGVTVSWEPPYDFGGVSASEVTYLVYREGAGAPVEVPGTQTSTTTAALPPGAHTFWVVARNEAGDSEASQPVTTDFTAPVTGLRAVGGVQQVVLGWTPSVSTDVQAVMVYAASGTTVSTAGEPKATVPVGTNYVTITGLPNGRRVTVALVAVDESGNVAPPVTQVLSGSTLSAVGSAASVASGSPVRIRGRLTRFGTNMAMPARKVTLYGRRRGTSAWSAVTYTMTSSVGTYAFLTRPTSIYDYEVRYAGTTNQMGARSPVVAVNVS